MVKEKISKECRERLKILKAQNEKESIRHKNRMEELTYERETAKKIHEWILERGRIQRAEKRRMMHESKQLRDMLPEK